jgi:hypothetical protein
LNVTPPPFQLGVRLCYRPLLALHDILHRRTSSVANGA